jgi:hypothetical protein
VPPYRALRSPSVSQSSEAKLSLPPWAGICACCCYRPHTQACRHMTQGLRCARSEQAHRSCEEKRWCPQAMTSHTAQQAGVDLHGSRDPRAYAAPHAAISPDVDAPAQRIRFYHRTGGQKRSGGRHRARLPSLLKPHPCSNLVVSISLLGEYAKGEKKIE